MDDADCGPRCGIDEILVTDRFTSTPSRTSDPARHNEVLVDLLHELATRPDGFLRQLCAAIVMQTNIESAGVSVLEFDDGIGTNHTPPTQVFHWHATAGAFIDHAGAMLPRHDSPCGVAMDRGQPLLFAYPQRHYPGLQEAEPAIHELLTLPFYVDGIARGTIWAIIHDADQCFDHDDLRLLTQAADFAALGIRLAGDFKAREHTNIILQRAYSEQHTRSVRLRELANALTNSENRARREVAAELQENLQQVLIAARLQLASGHGESKPVARASDLIDEAVGVSRKLVADLRPPTLYELGLLPALHWLADELHRQGILDVQIECDDETGNITLNDDVRGLLYEGVRELLCNVIKHAGTRRALIHIGVRDDSIALTVRDHGHGTAIDSAKLEQSRGVSLFSLHERLAPLGGHMRIDSIEGQGTRVQLVMPLTAGDESPEWPGS
ncbi:MAG: ATP-binding protein [Halofilum sp. (in: g-proteobacteria)]